MTSPVRPTSPDDFARAFEQQRGGTATLDVSPDDFAAEFERANAPKVKNPIVAGAQMGARTGLMNTGGGMQAIGRVSRVGFPNAGRLIESAGKLWENIGAKIPEAAGRVMRFRDVKNWRDAASWAAYNASQGVVSSLPSIGAGVATGGVGAVPAAMGVMYPQMVGEMRRELEQPGVGATKRDLSAIVAGVPLAALEGLFEGKLASSVMKKAVGGATRTLPGRIAAEVASGAVTEGLTEGAQEGTQIATSAAVTGHTPSAQQMFERITEAAAGGAVGGATIGGGVAAATWRPRSREEIRAQQTLVQGKTAGRPPAAPAAAPPAAAQAPAAQPVPAPTPAPLPENPGNSGSAAAAAAPISEVDQLKAELQTERNRRNDAERQASMHPLTGLPNQNAFARARATAEADPAIGIASFDANGFKAVNDALGHDQGDELLKHIGESLKKAAAAHPGVRVFHKGGDEFALIGPNDLVATVRDEVEQSFGVIEPAEGLRVSLSGGIGNTFADADTELRTRKQQHKAEQQIPERGAAPVQAPAVVRAVQAEQALASGVDPEYGGRMSPKRLSDIEKARVTASKEALETPPAPTLAPSTTHGAVEMPEGLTMPEGLAIEPDSRYAQDDTADPAQLFAAGAQQLDQHVGAYVQAKRALDALPKNAKPKQRQQLEAAVEELRTLIGGTNTELDDAFHPDVTSNLIDQVFARHGVDFDEFYPDPEKIEGTDAHAAAQARAARERQAEIDKGVRESAEKHGREAAKRLDLFARSPLPDISGIDRDKPGSVEEAIAVKLVRGHPETNWPAESFVRLREMGASDAEILAVAHRAFGTGGGSLGERGDYETGGTITNPWFKYRERSPLDYEKIGGKKLARALRSLFNIPEELPRLGLEGAPDLQNPVSVGDVSGVNTVPDVKEDAFEAGLVRDEDGNPLVLYHGTRKDFTRLTPRPAIGWGTGIYFTDNGEQAAEEWGFGGRVIRAHVSIQKPYRGHGIPAGAEDTRAWQRLEKKWDRIEDAWQEDSDFMNAVLRELGYDGVIAENSNDVRGLEVVAFHAAQVRELPAEQAKDEETVEFTVKPFGKPAETLSVPKDPGKKKAKRTNFGSNSPLTDGIDAADMVTKEPAIDSPGEVAQREPEQDGADTRRSALEDAGTAASKADIATLVDALAARIGGQDPTFTPATLRAFAANRLGRDISTGTWQMDDVYDALEGAVNRVLGPRLQSGLEQIAEGDAPILARLDEVLKDENLHFRGRPGSVAVATRQQYSTPLPLAFAAQIAARVRATDVVLEPTAGTGNLVNALGKRARVNELDTRRRYVLEALDYEPTAHDALKLPLLGVRANVVIMNPPYGNVRKGMYHGFGAAPFNATDVAQRFVAQALESLPVGGRLVAVMPSSTIGSTGAAFRSWLAEIHTPLAYLASYEEAYRSRGARLDTVIMVVDKGKRPGEQLPPLVQAGPLTFDQWSRAVQALAEDERFARWGDPAPAVDGKAIIAVPGGVSSTKGATSDDTTNRDEGPDAATSGAAPVARGPGGEPGGSRSAVDSGRGSGEPGLDTGSPADRPRHAASDVVAERAPGNPEEALEAPAADVAPLDLGGGARAPRQEPAGSRGERAEAASSAVFVPVVLDDATVRSPHPRLVVETRSMAGMPSPKPKSQLQSKAVLEARDRPGANGGISDEQVDMVRRVTSAWENRHGFLVADDVGVGKAREAGALVLEAIARGAKRILYTTKNANNVEDAIREFRHLATGSEDGEFPAQIIRVNEHKDASRRRNRIGALPMPTDTPALYIVDSYNFAEYSESMMDLKLDTWIADEAHTWKQQESARGMAWGALHKEMLDRNVARFAYLTATPAVSLDEIGYLYGLREWTPGSFTRWLDVITGKAPASELSELAKKASASAAASDVGDIEISKDPRKKKIRMSTRDVYTQRITPAETEQVMRELKGKGKYLARDLWRGGVDFAVAHVDLMGDTDESRAMRARFDQVAELVRDLQRAARKYGYLNAKIKTTGAERALLQGYVKQLTFDAKLDQVLRDARAALDAGEQVVISVSSVTGDNVTEEGVSEEDLPDELRQGNKRLIAAANRINTKLVEKEGKGDEAEYIDLGDIPEALMEVEAIKERIAKLPPLRDPVKTIEEYFGAKNVSVITGQRNPAQRRAAMAEFQAGDRPVALISAAGKTGISLHDVNGKRRNLLVADYEWSADTFKQELGRVDRTGQLTSPKIRLYASNFAPEARFSSNIAALMASLGAVSKGSAESTGTDALDAFDLSDGFAKVALEELWYHMSDADKSHAVGRAFVERQRNAEGGFDENVKRQLETGVEVRQFFLELMGFPVDVAQRAYSRWMEIRDRLRHGDESGEHAARRTQQQSGTVMRRTELVKDAGKGPISLIEVQYEGTTEKGGIVQGFVTQHIEALQRARASETGAPRSRRYVRFTDTATGELVAGLEVTAAEARRVRAMFRDGKVTAPTKAEAIEALELGEDIPVRGDRRYSRDGDGRWVLHRRKLMDGRVRFEIRGLPFSAARDALKHANGAKLKASAEGSPYVFIESDDKDSLSKFLDAFPPAAPNVPPAGGSSFGGSTFAVADPFTAAALMVRQLRQMKAKRDREAKPLVEATREDVERRLKHAEGGRVPPTIVEKARAALAAIATAGRHFEHVDAKAGPREAQTYHALLEGERSAKYGQARAYNLLWQVTDGLTRGQVRTMTRYLALTDILKDVEAGLYEGKGIPFGFADRAELEAEIAKLETAVKATPAVFAAAQKRGRLVRAVTEAAVEADLLSEKVLEDPRYFHRQVLEYMALSDNAPFVRTGQRDVRVGKRGYQKGRTGGGDFNLRYQEAEFEWLSQALRQLHTKDVLGRLDGMWNEHDALRTEARTQNKAAWQDKVLAPIRRKLEREGASRVEIEGMMAEMDPDRPYRMRIARASQELHQLIASGEIILPAHLEHVQLSIAEAVENGGTPGAKGWWAAIAHLAENDGDGSMQARVILKAINDREVAMRTELGPAYVNPRDPDALLRLAPDGYVTWQPVKGNHFYTAVAIAERYVDEVLGAGKLIGSNEVREVLALGGPRETWIIPDWLAETLDNFGRQRANTLPEKALMKLQSLWKMWTLNAPHRTIKYNVNNLFGDGDVAMLYPGIFKGAPRAARDLWAHFVQRRKDKALIHELEELTRLGVVDNTLTVAEIPDVSKLPAFERLVENNPVGVMSATMGYFGAIRTATQIRENILRVAAYRWALAELRAGRKGLYGAAPKHEMDATKGLEEKAALFARTLLGDYQAISTFGGWARDRIVPFFSWWEVNGRRYVNIIRNLRLEGQNPARVAGAIGIKVGVATAARAAKTVVLANAFLVGVALWNRLKWPEEDELLRAQGITGRFILGRDHEGKIRSIRAEGAFADFLNWVSLGDYPALVQDLIEAKTTWGDVVKDGMKAPVNRVVNAWEPFTKTGAEMIFGQSAYPDAFNPRPIRERQLPLFRMWGLENLYKKVTGRPTPAGSFSPLELLSYKVDPGEAAYFIARDMVSDWNRGRGRDRSAPAPTDRDNALYYYKYATKVNDQAAADRWLRRYYELGGKRENASKALKVSSAPLAGIPLSERLRFRNALAPRERALVEEAEKWWRETYREGPGPVPSKALASPSSRQ